MKADAVKFLEFLSVRKQFIIPIYQRTYSWSRKQCQQLWEDILRVATDNDIHGHFIGSVVYIEEGIYHVSSTAQLLVIDGQQRLTTISLILLALARAIQAEGADETTFEEIFEYYLVNPRKKGELRYKLMLTRSDKETLINLLEGHDLPEQSAQRIINNYRFFEDCIRRREISLEAIIYGIQKLVVVDVALNREHDNPQLIFESLNSTGLDLSQADLIRNYILMGLEQELQNELYEKYWYPMERRFGHAEYSALFDRFMRDFLTIKSDAGQIPVLREIYSEFKRYMQNGDVREIVADVYRYSEYFVRLAFPERNQDADVHRILEGINTLKVDVAYPFLIEVYEDYLEYSLLDRDEFVEILELVESYVVRRAIVGIPTNSMNKTFATLKRFIDKDHYLASVKYAFLTLDSYRRFPRDEEFWSEFISKDIYNLRQRRNYILSRLENFDRKEFVNVEAYTIEHIMPQNPKLSPSWQLELGDNWKSIQEQNIHTIGNLTLTGYNPELSDRPFLEKRDIKGGFADSPLRLNRSLAKLDHWGKTEIDDRAAELADLALKIWALPILAEEAYEFFAQEQRDPEESNLAHFEHLNGEMGTLFGLLRTRLFNLDASVKEEPKQSYIAYKITSNFTAIVPQKNRLRLLVNMDFDDIDDPQNICHELNHSHYGTAGVDFGISSEADLEYAMFLIKQSFEQHAESILT